MKDGGYWEGKNPIRRIYTKDGELIEEGEYIWDLSIDFIKK